MRGRQRLQIPRSEVYAFRSEQLAELCRVEQRVAVNCFVTFGAVVSDKLDHHGDAVAI